MDLRDQVPHSPFAEFDGIPWLPRMLDKARAALVGTLGDYLFPCPMDQAFLEFHGLEAEMVLERLRRGDDEAAIAALVRKHASGKTREEMHAFKQELLFQPPADPDKRSTLERIRVEIAARSGVEPEQIDTFAKAIALDEGHPLP